MGDSHLFPAWERGVLAAPMSSRPQGEISVHYALSFFLSGFASIDEISPCGRNDIGGRDDKGNRGQSELMFVTITKSLNLNRIPFDRSAYADTSRN